jgi:hypothetical protein
MNSASHISRIGLAILVACQFLPTSRALAREPINLRFDGPPSLKGKPGAVVRATYHCVVGAAEDRKPEGWAVGVAAEGAKIIGITVLGTDAEHAVTYGFERSEVTAGPDNDGAISKVVYSLTDPRWMPVGSLPGPAIAAVEVEAVIPAVRGTARLLYRDGLRGTVNTVENYVEESGRRLTPPALYLGDLDILLVADRSVFSLGFDGPAFFSGTQGSVTKATQRCLHQHASDRLRTRVAPLGIHGRGA